MDMWDTNEMFKESHYFEFICKVHKDLINEHVVNQNKQNELINIDVIILENVLDL